MLSIANNVASLTAQHNLGRTNTSLGKSIERLSSGLKVNRGADGPAALVISEKQRAQIAGLKQGIENTDKAVSVVQTAEGALNEINSLLVKVRSLALDSANSGVNDADALAANQAEIDNALETIDRISDTTQFGTKKLLDGSAGLQGIATNADVEFLTASSDTTADTYAIAVTTAGERANYSNSTSGSAQTTALANDEVLTINGVSVSLNAGMSQTAVIDRINEYSGQTGVVAEDDSGATRLRTEQFGSSASVSVVSNRAAAGDSSGFGTTEQSDAGEDVRGTIGGTAFVGTGNVLTANSGAMKGISVQIGAASDGISTATSTLDNVTVTDNSLTFQLGPNRDQTVQVGIDNMNTQSLGLGNSGNQFNSLSEIKVTSDIESQDAIDVIDSAIDQVTNLRGKLGAFQANTLEATGNNMRETLENSVNAESIIRDTDFASEIANFTKQQVLMQAGTNVLGNANQSPQLILSLLG